MRNSGGIGPLSGRRRFLRICAAGAAGLALSASGVSAEARTMLHRWRGIALGAKAEINLLHEDAGEAQRLFGRIEAELRRLESIFSLYRSDSELSRLNAEGRLMAPSLELVELLGLCAQVHNATDGAFDPTVQPLWVHYARRSAGENVEDFALVKKRIGFHNVAVEPGQIRFARKGMAMTFNGIAQGYVTDKISSHLAAAGCTNMIVDIGEIAARGVPEEASNDGRGWQVTLQPVSNRPEAATKVRLDNQAVASSARLGTTFDRSGRQSHILDPRTGAPVEGGLSGASVLAPNAALADGLSTAALVCGESRLATALAGASGMRGFVVRNDGTSGWIGA